MRCGDNIIEVAKRIGRPRSIVRNRRAYYCVLAGKLAVLLFVASYVAILSSRNLGIEPTITQGGEDPDPEIRHRRNFVKRMMKDAWDDYTKNAWGENELQPLNQTGRSGDLFGSARFGATIVDSLDTLYIMEMMEEYHKARDFVADLTFQGVTNIRFIGGFLAAYALTHDRIYTEKALELATLLLPAFNTKLGLPYAHVNLKTGLPAASNRAVLAEIGSLHLEFMYLSDLTGDVRFREKVLDIRKVMKDIKRPNGLYSNTVNINTGQFASDHVSIGANGDSFYEYLLKASIMFQDREARELYDSAMDAFVNNGLVKVSQPSHLLYIAESMGDHVSDRVGHLACFAGGMFVLGAHVEPNNKNAFRDKEIGLQFTNCCRESYIRTNTRIGPEVFRFNSNVEAVGELPEDLAYILRPEVIESYFVLYRITGDKKYRDWGWDAAQAIQRYTKAGPGRGYSGIRNVNDTKSLQDDVMQTFFLAETLKYLYLLFSTNDLISLDQWVFNTECHPLPIKGVNPNY